MSTKQTMTSEQQKATKPSRKKYKQAKKTNKSQWLDKKDTRRSNSLGTPARAGSAAQKRSESTGKPSKKKSKGTAENTASRTRKEQKKRQKAEKKANKRPVRRIFPIWLRLIVIPLLCVVALLLGAMVGYGVLGDGNPLDALNRETWKHIMDIIDKK